MEILGIGPIEFVFVIIILLLVLGPADLITLGQKAGRLIRTLRNSETWIMVTNLSRALRNLPTALAEESGMEDLRREMVRPIQKSAPGSLSLEDAVDRSPQANRVQPPAAEAYAPWTTPVPPETEPSPEAQNPPPEGGSPG